MTSALDHLPEAPPEGRIQMGCCNPRPWEPVCVGCPGRRFSPELVIEGFAGPGGWSEGLRQAGFTGTAVGFELDWQACKTAMAAGHQRVQADVSAAALTRLVRPGVNGALMSPPCPPWSMSGRRLGPLDRRNVLRRIDAFADGHTPEVVEWNDPRSFLCAEPMRWAVALRPRWIALEQVPGALPLWQHIGGHLETMGYSVVTGVLRCEEYGVPQTRKRAVLVARMDGVATLPAPTHRRYRKGVAQHEGDSRHLPWVSMHDAIGWGMTDRPAWTVTAGGVATGGAEVFGNAKCRALLGGRRPTHAEAAALQGFPPGYPFSGDTKGVVSRQIGDAVPPPLATAILRPLISSVSAVAA